MAEELRSMWFTFEYALPVSGQVHKQSLEHVPLNMMIVFKVIFSSYVLLM